MVPMIAQCQHCGEPFEYWEEGTKGWLPRVGEEISCPDCGHVYGRHMTIGYVRSRKLTAEQRQAYEQARRESAADKGKA